MANEIRERIVFDDSQVVKSLQDQLAMTNKINDALRTTEMSYSTAFKVASDQLKESQKAIEQGTKKIGEHITATNEARKSGTSWGQVLHGISDEINVMGVNIGSVITSLRNKAQTMKTVASSVGGATNALKIFKVALISSGVGALVVALGGLVALLTKTQQGTDKVSQVMAGLGAAVNVFLDRWIKGAGALIKLYTGDFKGAFADAKAAVSGLTDELHREVGAAVELEKQMQRLKDRVRELGKEQATRATEISRLELIASDQAKTHAERIDALRESNRLKGLTDKENLSIEEENYNAIVKKNQALDEGRKDQEGEAQAFIALENKRKEAYENQITNTRKITGMEEAQREARAAAHAQRMAQMKAANEALQNQIDRIQAAYQKVELSRLSPSERIQKEADIALAIIDEQFKLLDELAKAAGKEVDFAKEKAAFIVQIEKEKIEAINKLREEDRQEVAKIEDMGQKRTRERMEETIEDIKAIAPEAVEAILTPMEMLNKKLGEVFMLTGDQFQGVMNSMADSLNRLFDSMTSGTDRQLEENNALIESIQERRSVLEDDLARELERQEVGLANNIEGKRKELEAINKEEEKAEKEREKLRKKQLAQKLIADSLTQSSNLLTMGSNVIAAESGKGLLGVAFAIAAIAAFVGVFSSFKANSKKLYKGGPLGQEGVTGFVNKNGRTDKNGGKGHRVEDSNVVLGGREFVVNEVAAMKHSEFLEALNRGEFDSGDGLHFAMGHAKEMEHGSAIVGAMQERRNNQGVAAAMASMIKTSLDSSIGKLIGVIKEKPDTVAYTPGQILRKEANGKVTITQTEADWKWKPEARG